MKLLSVLKSAVVFFSPVFCFAQQGISYGNIRENWCLLNPAFLDFRYYDHSKKEHRPDRFLSGGVKYHHLNQNIGTMTANLRYELFARRTKLSGGIIADKLGSFTQAGVFGQYGYQILKNKLTLAYGFKLTGQWLDIKQTDFADFDNDPIAQEVVNIRFGMNFFSDLGLSYIISSKKYDKIYTGIGVTQIRSSEYNDNLPLLKKPEYNIFLGAILPLKKNGTNNRIQLEPLMMVRYTNIDGSYWFHGLNSRKPLTIDASFRFTNMKSFQKTNDLRLGIGGSTAGVIQFEVGIILNKKNATVISPILLALPGSAGTGIELAHTYSWQN
jgi:hypothetical protein